MENDELNQIFIHVDLNEEQAAKYDTGAGLRLINCAGDPEAKELFLRQQLSSEDKQALCEGDVTEHLHDVVDEIGGFDVNDVFIEYNRDIRDYEIWVTERIPEQIPELAIIF